ncbi:hypothetical protein scyTo_0024263 [Scyliorhinus torazame]|uniref:Uncharacterized protein n=1 Tax=Scyliorhinus torazame TaxID=75743 RepID=A0A401QEP3_SCYTO|nr:hypothetical protein [Scyliorhinus torazame]
MKIRGCLAMNIISSIACLPAVLIYAVNLAYPGYCYYLYNSIFCYYHQGTIPCLVILLLLTLLITALSIAVSSLNCKAMNCCCATPQSTVVVLANPAAQFIPQQPFPANPPPYNIQATSTVNVG